MTNETKKPGKALKIILPLLVLLLSVGGFALLNNMKQVPQRQTKVQRGVLVDVVEIQAVPHQIRIYATGTVQPAQQISLVPEVNGKVIWISSQLVNGGFFKQGETLLKVEPADYRLAVQRAQADIARAKVLDDVCKYSAKTPRDILNISRIFTISLGDKPKFSLCLTLIVLNVSFPSECCLASDNAKDSSENKLRLLINPCLHKNLKLPLFLRC